MKKVIIFGATGNVGSYVTKYASEFLPEKGFEVVATGRRNTDVFDQFGVKFVQVDMMNNPDTANAQDTPGSAYWSILASTDFTSTTWTGSSEDYTCSWSPTTSKGGNPIGWKLKYGTHTSDSVVVDSNGVGFPWVSDSYKYQGFMYMSSYNNQTTNTIFNGIDNFKVDLAFSFTGSSKCATGYDLDERRSGTCLLKLAKDSKYSFNSKYTDQANFFTQEAWGRRSVDDDYYKPDGDAGTMSSEKTACAPYAISTYNSNSIFTTSTTYHYVVYYVDKMIGCYITDDSGNVILNNNPLEVGSYNFTADMITSIYLGASEFNFWGKYDMENIAYKSIEIYKGVDTHTYDSSRDKFLYAYFKGDSDAGETMHYAISQDGVNFEAVSGGAQVWNPATNGATDTYPSTDSAPYSDSVAISNHVRDSYAFIGQDGKDYVIATDLNTNNGSWGSIQNSRFLLWKMDFFGDINDTRPISIDTSKLPGMDAITGGTSGTHKTVKKAWAPQVIYDPDVGKYMLYWSVGADGISTQIYYTYTSDFKTDFTTVKRLLFPDFDGEGIDNHIDADITYHNGLYYCYFKNEDGSGTGSKRIWYAVAPHANGPYTDFELINTSYGAEGPQVYETGNNSYMLMVDGYGNHTYHMYSAGSPYDFDTEDETSTNVTDLSPRHGSIVRITDAEYQKLKKLRIGSEKRYAWEGAETTRSHNTSYQDSTGLYYHVTWNPNASTTTTGNGVLSITDSGMYCEDSDVQTYIGSDIYSVTFYYKSNGSTTRDDNHSIFSISNSGSVTNYVRLSSNGKFIVNNSQVAVSGNCSDGTTTRASKLSSAVTDTSEFHRFTVTSDGLITSLIIDGEFICQTISGMDIPNTLWITFGWARIDGVENNRLTAQFGQIVFKNVATETDKQDELYDTLKPANVTAGTFNATVYHEDSACTGGYSNVVWSPKNMSWSGKDTPGGNNDSNIQYTNSKIAQQRQAVLAYDGAHQVYMPVVYETYCEASHSNKTDYVSSNGSVMKLTQNWTGYQDGNYTQWPGSSSGTSIGYDDSHKSEYSFNNTKTHRFFWNKLFYTGTGDTTNYYETQGNLTFYSHNYKNYWGSGWNGVNMYSANTYYVINYKPIYDILNGTTKVPNTDNMTISQLFANDADNRWMYTKDSYVQAMYAMKLLADCNPNNYNYSSDAAGQVAKCGQDIKKAIDAFNAIDLKKNKFNITYRMADGSTRAEVVTAGNNLASVPSNTATYHIFDSNKHMKNCRWTSVSAEAVPSGASAYNPSATPSTSVTPKANTIYTETGTVEDCETAHVAADGDTNGYTRYECSICGETNDDYRMWDTVDPATSTVLSTLWTTYDTHASAIETNVADTQYTTSSRTAYETAANTAISDVTLNDETKSKTYIDNKITALTNAERKLNPVADFAALDATVTTATYSTKRAENNTNAGAQKYTYDTWVAFASNYDGGKAYHDYNAATRADTPKYKVDGSGYVMEKIAANYSDDQTAINTYNANIPTTYSALASVDAADAYTNFDNAKTLISSTLDSRKYTDDGLNYINGQIDTAYGNVYKTLTDEEATEYNSYTGGGYAAGAKLKRTTTGATDTQTGTILTASNNLNSAANKNAYIKKYNVSFTVQDDESGTSVGTGKINNETVADKNISYGDTATLEVPDTLLGSTYSGVAVWGTENRNDANTATEGSQKVSGTNNNKTYVKVVSGNIAVTAGLSKNEITSDKYRYNVQNVYGEVVEVYYGESTISEGTVASITLPGTSTPLEAKEIPFYTFQNWTVTDKGNKVYNIKPNYTVAEATYDFTVTGGTITTTRQDYDKKVKVDTANTNFVAWAVRTSSGKYQIASYNHEYQFFACASENFVAIVPDGNGGYQTTDAEPVPITGANIDGVVASGTSLTDAQKTALVNDKLANQKPFIAIENVKMTNTQARVYARITQGATGNTGFGVYYKGGTDLTPSDDAGAVKRNVTSVLSTGQFTYTLTNKNGFSANTVLFKCFVNYPGSYEYEGTSYTINAVDLSDTQVAHKNA
ncbi:MAG: hypothetical protein IJI47_05505 [Eubacterium sp.]|nr:hypothetical protein [Eubacterium sp.]